jgi:hypothetical protein
MQTNKTILYYIYFQLVTPVLAGNTCNNSSQNIFNCGGKCTLKCEKNYIIVLPQPKPYQAELAF